LQAHLLRLHELNTQSDEGNMVASAIWGKNKSQV